MTARRRRSRVGGVLPVAFAALAVAGCSAIGQGELPPDGRAHVARNASDCLSAVRGVIRRAPASANDPATGAWLSRADRLRDAARALGDVTSRQLAGELDYAGALVALDGFPPQLAIVPVQATCTISYSLDRQAARAAVIPAARAWVAANPPPGRPGMTAGIITQWSQSWLPCPSPSPRLSHGSDVAMGNGCPAWAVTLTTATGTLHVSCGDPGGTAVCDKDPWKAGPDIGDELYAPGNGQVARAADITIISQPPWGNWQAGVAALIKAAQHPAGTQ